MINELTSEIQFRSPCCHKLYFTDREDVAFDLKHSYFEFHCESCESDFYLKNQKDSTGLYLTEKRLSHEFINCSKCLKLKNKLSDECPHCGVLESQYKELIKLESPRLYELNKIWAEILTQFNSEDLHQKFLNRSQQLAALNFAAKKYHDLQSHIGQNKDCEKYLNQIELRLLNRDQGLEVATEIKENFWQGIKKNFFGIEYSARNFLLFFAISGFIFFILNIVKPMLPSVNGIVLAMVVMSVGLWSISKNQSKNY